MHPGDHRRLDPGTWVPIVGLLIALLGLPAAWLAVPGFKELVDGWFKPKITTTGDEVIDPQIQKLEQFKHRSTQPTESQLAETLAPLFNRPEFYEIRNDNWRDFLYALCRTRKLLEEYEPDFKTKAAVREHIDHAIHMMVDLQNQAAAVYSPNFSISEHIRRYGDRKRDFIDELPRVFKDPTPEFFQARNRDITAVRAELGEAGFLDRPSPSARSNPATVERTPSEPDTLSQPTSPAKNSVTSEISGGQRAAALSSASELATIPAPDDLKWWNDVTDQEVLGRVPIQLYSAGCSGALAFENNGRVLNSKTPSDFLMFRNSDESLSLVARSDRDYGLAVDNGVLHMKYIPVEKGNLPPEFRFRLRKRGLFDWGAQYAKGCAKVAPEFAMGREARLIEPVAAETRVLAWSPVFHLAAPPKQIGVPTDFEKTAVFLMHHVPAS